MVPGIPANDYFVGDRDTQHRRVSHCGRLKDGLPGADVLGRTPETGETMLTEKLLRILRSKSSFTEAQLASMTEAEGWRWVYSQPKTRESGPPQVCFTGFPVDEKAELAALASKAGLDVVRSVTKRLAYLCIGEEPGPAKLEKAGRQEVTILDRRQFERMLATGEIPLGPSEAA